VDIQNRQLTAVAKTLTQARPARTLPDAQSLGRSEAARHQSIRAPPAFECVGAAVRAKPRQTRQFPDRRCPPNRWPPQATTAPVSTGSGPTRVPSASASTTYQEVIIEALSHWRNATVIWQDLVDHHRFHGMYASVRREEAQPDYGDDPRSGISASRQFTSCQWLASSQRLGEQSCGRKNRGI
jgi:hypothetical protein